MSQKYNILVGNSGRKRPQELGNDARIVPNKEPQNNTTGLGFMEKRIILCFPALSMAQSVP
jgi:hypothetical protein